MKPSRGVDLSGLADSAGIMASSSGSETVAPTPLRKVRLCNDFLVTNVMRFSCCALLPILTPLAPRRRCFACRRRFPHLERRTLDHSHNQGSKPVIIVGGLFDDGANGRPIVVLHIAPNTIHHQFLRDSGHELFGVTQQSRFQSRHPVEFFAAGENARGIDWVACILVAPSSYPVEILHREADWVHPRMATGAGRV